ncbi:MAG: ShlB/FhaC/HecB family hemolysin secretion/activation protein [Alphaproteobacteria bacterium]|nr:ShlB/FhaC/HecB family hemolysin secretion/activation protein [Alphaproteobacteria bacterium]
MLKFKRIIFIWLLCGHVYAQASVPDEVKRQQEQIIGRGELQQKQREEQFKEQSLPQSQETLVESEKEQVSEKKFFIQDIRLEGSTKLTPDEYNPIFQKYLNKNITISQINEILRDLTNAYIQQGYLTSRVYLPAQDLKSGILKICVLEGHVESLNVTRNGEKNTPAFAFPNREGDILNIRDLEQGIDQINRLSSYDAKISLDAGKQDGGSDVHIQTVQKFPVSVRMGVDNYGSKSTGVRQIDVQTTYDNLFGLYDSWGVDIRRDADFLDKNHFTKSYGFQSSIPFGYYTVRYFGNRFDYRSTVKGRAQDFQFSGKTRTHKIETEALIHRDSLSKTLLTTSLTTKNTRNFVGDVELSVGSQRLTLLSFSFGHLRRIMGGAFYGSLTQTTGIHGFKASKNENMQRSGPRPQFNKLSTDISYTKPFSFFPLDLNISTRNCAQYSRQTLFSSERISFGGAQTVRGFQQNGLAGDVGFYSRNELEVNLYAPKSGDFKTVAGRLTAFTGMDYGWIRKSKGDKSEHGVLKSMFLGVRLKEGKTETEVIISNSLKQPSFLRKEGVVFHVRFGVSL